MLGIAGIGGILDGTAHPGDWNPQSNRRQRQGIGLSGFEGVFHLGGYRDGAGHSCHLVLYGSMAPEFCLSDQPLGGMVHVSSIGTAGVCDHLNYGWVPRCWYYQGG